jgi:N-acyl-L-homoserine lactone synthetase
MKLKVLSPKSLPGDGALRAAMFRQRTEVFANRLGWANMTIVNGEERDEADCEPAAEYLVSVDPDGSLVGSCRLVPVAGQSLLRGPLASYMDRPLAANGTGWELTRFAPATDPADPRHGRSFGLLAAGVLAWALKRSVTRVYGIADHHLMGIAGGLGWQISIEGQPIEYEPGKVAFAFSFPIDQATFSKTCGALRMASVPLEDAADSTLVAA